MVASGDLGIAARLGLSMALLQFAIGTVNDLVDAPVDAGRKPGKPIPAGLLTPAVGRAVAAATALGGLLLAMASGPGVLGLAGLGLAIGMAYDLRLKGTAWSWVPLASGVPLVPVFGWYGATGTLPPLFLALVPIAALEGAALAIANALVDVERDQDAGEGSVATMLGLPTASSVVVALQVLVGVLAVGTAVASGAPFGWVVAAAVSASVPVSGALVGLAAAVRRPAWREAAWEVQAVGAGLLAVAWLGSLGAAGTLGEAAGR
jgi:4-hydroxybenzoate polyprenyltransferase